MRLGEVCDVVRGSSPRPKSDSRFYGGIVPRLMVADLTRDGKVVSARIDTLTELGAKQSRPMTRGDVMIAVSGAPGLPAILAHDACIHDGFVGLRDLDGSRLDAEFLYAYLTFVRATNNSQAVGAIFKNLTTDQIKGIEIPELPLAEQRRIAEVLDRAEALRAKRCAALAQLDSLTQSFFLDLFGDPTTNSKSWKRVEMTEAVVGKYGIKAGPFGSSLKKEDYTTSGYRIYGQEQVIAGRFDIGDYYIGERKYQQLKSCAVAQGDLLVSLVGSFGKVLIVPVGIEPGIINPRLLKITPNQTLVTPDFLAALLQHPTVQAEFQRVAHGGTMGILNAGLLKQLKVILPPIELQREFARRVLAVEKLKTAQRASLAELDALFASLQHCAFRGEL